MGYQIRAVRPEDWRKAKELRLTALQDPISSRAFMRTYDEEAAFSDEVWQQRAQTQAFVAEEDSGDWTANVTVLQETGPEYPVRQTHLVAVYVRPEDRGTGLAEELLRTAIDWSWALPGKVDRVRLWVHGDNPRARAFYRRLGFVRTGRTEPWAHDESQIEHEMALERPER